MYGAIVARGPSTADGVDAFNMATLILGGTHSSDLAHHLRQETGASYSVGASFSRLRGASWATVSGSYTADLLTASLQSSLDAIDKLRGGTVSPDDLRAAKEVSLARWRESMSSASGAAAAYALAVATSDMEGVRNYPARIAKVDRDAIVAVAQKYLGRDSLRIVVAGDEQKLSQLSSLGMGAPILLSEDQSAPTSDH